MKKVVIGYAAAIILLLVCVWLFTRTAFIDAFRLAQFDSVADAINGLTAPVIALITGGLLFYSFQAQLKANQLLQSQWQIDTFLKVFDDLDRKFEELTISTEDANSMGSGVTHNIKPRDFIEFVCDYINNKYLTLHYLNELTFVLEDLSFVGQIALDAPRQHKKFFSQKVMNYYRVHFKEKLPKLAESTIDESEYFRFMNSYTDLRTVIEQLEEYELQFNIDHILPVGTLGGMRWKMRNMFWFTPKEHERVNKSSKKK